MIYSKYHPSLATYFSIFLIVHKYRAGKIARLCIEVILPTNFATSLSSVNLLNVIQLIHALLNGIHKNLKGVGLANNAGATVDLISAF